MLQRFLPLVLVVGCAVAGPAERPPPSAPPPASPAPVPSLATPDPQGLPASEPTGPAAPGLEPVARPPAPAGARVEIVAPKDGQSLSPAQAATTRLRLRAKGFALERAGRRIAVVLDDYRVRYVASLPTSIALGDLVPADRDLGSGSHELVAILVSESGELMGSREGAEPVATARFWVGPKQPTPSEPVRPRLVYVEPQGTYNGESQAASARLDYVVLGGDPTLSIRARRMSTAGTRSESSVIQSPQQITGLESGDYRFELTLVDATGAAPKSDAGSVARVVTVNLDARAATD